MPAHSSKARAAIHAAEVPRNRRLEFSPEVIMTMNKLDWLKLITINKVKNTRIEHYSLPLPNFTKYLRTWGEAGIIKTGKDGKIGDRGVTSMLVGYTSNHKGNCYRMWNPNTKKVSKTCDVVLLNQDERGGTITADFVTGDNAATVESEDSFLLDTPVVNNNLGQSKYGCTNKRTMHYDPATGCTVGAEATALANYYQCLEDMDGMMESPMLEPVEEGGLRTQWNSSH